MTCATLTAGGYVYGHGLSVVNGYSYPIFQVRTSYGYESINFGSRSGGYVSQINLSSGGYGLQVGGTWTFTSGARVEGSFYLDGIPSSDPHDSGRIWQDPAAGHALKQSQG